MSALVPQDPEYERKTREMFASQMFMQYIGARLLSLAPGRSEIDLPFRPELSQHVGFFHGGIIATLADNAGGAAGYTLLPPGFAALTVEFKVNIIAPGQGERLIARGQVVRAGKTLIVARSDVLAVSQGVEKPCATCLMTSIAIPR
jgi:uncharacterized protein (TIGR00369 family)